VNGGRAVTLIALLAVGACSNATPSGAANDAQVAVTDADVLNGPIASEDSAIAVDGARGAPEYGSAQPDASTGSPPDAGDEGAPGDDADDAGWAPCAPLSHGTAVLTVLRSLFDSGSIQAPSDTGGPITTGTYYLTARAVLDDPYYAPQYTCNVPPPMKDTYRFNAASTTSGSFDQDTELELPDGGISDQIVSGTYVLSNDPSFENIKIHPTCPASPDTTTLDYVATPTEITTVSYAYPPFMGQPGAPICTIISTYTKQ
jgi:hypothetical protein